MKLALTILVATATVVLATHVHNIIDDDIEQIKPANDPGWITDFGKKVVDRLTGKGEDHLKICQKTKERGGVPSAEKKDSPIDVFGFPYFHEGTKRVTVRPGVTLSYMFGRRQPIKLGSRDYVISGWAKELIAFCKCFEDYDVIGSSLDQDGHWYPNTGSLKIQLSNVNPDSQSLNSELWEMLFKISMDRLVKFLNPMKIIAAKEAIVLGNKSVSSLSQMQQALEKVKKWLPGSDKFIAKILELFAKEGDLKDKMKEFIQFYKDEEKKKDALRKHWVGIDNVNKERKLMITLTMYPKPENRVRTTYNFGKATIKVKDIGEALMLFFSKGNK